MDTTSATKNAAKAISTGLRSVAQRMQNADDAFIANVVERGFTEEQGTKVLAVYRKARVIKLDAVNGVWSVVMGQFWERAVLERAITS